MKEYFLPIGQRQEAVLLPEEHVIYDIHGNAATVCADVVAAAREAIRNPIGTKPLREIVKAGESVAIVISDITRLCGTKEFLPVIVEELNSVGVKDEDITVVVATGTHRGHTHEEDITVCGEEMVRRLRIIQHDSRKKEDMVSLGKTSFAPFWAAAWRKNCWLRATASICWNCGTAARRPPLPPKAPCTTPWPLPMNG